MRSAHRFAAAAFVWLASSWFGAGQGAAASCDSLAGMKVGDASITAAGNISSCRMVLRYRNDRGPCGADLAPPNHGKPPAWKIIRRELRKTG